MYVVKFRMPGSGMWQPWLSPQTMQAAAGQAASLKRESVSPEVRIDTSATPAVAGRLDIRA